MRPIPTDAAAWTAARYDAGDCTNSEEWDMNTTVDGKGFTAADGSGVGRVRKRGRAPARDVREVAA